MIRIDTPEKSRLIVTRIAEFVALPFRHGTAKQSAGEPSFIAFSKASMDALQSLMGNPVSVSLDTSGLELFRVCTNVKSCTSAPPRAG